MYGYFLRLNVKFTIAAFAVKNITLLFIVKLMVTKKDNISNHEKYL